MKKVLINDIGSIEIKNIKTTMLEPLVKKMKEKETGQCVCRQFVLGKKYTMLITDIVNPIESNKVELSVAIWPDNSDALYYVTRTVPIYVTDRSLHMWEAFCEKISGGKAIWERDLLGIFFIGHIDISKVKTPNGVFSYEQIYVDKYLDRLDANRIEFVPYKNSKGKYTNKTSIMLSSKSDEDDE